MPFEQCRSITSIMSGFDKPWFFAGGWAIDLFIDRKSRHHQDIEIAIFREDQLHMKEYLNDWDFNKVIKGEFYPWGNEYLELPIHEIHAVNKTNGDQLEILLNETRDADWRFRRDLTITYPLESVWSNSVTGIPYLNPEIVLLYKVKNTREKDHQDFMEIKDYLDDEKRKWLRNTIRSQEPEHNWIQLLE